MLGELCSKQTSRNGRAIKYMWNVQDEAKIGAVLFDLPDRSIRHAICCSSQFGCAQGCKFCATGRKNLFLRGLSAEEISEQVGFIVEDNILTKTPFEVSFMATGEPLLNYDNIILCVRNLQKIYPTFKQIYISTIGTSGIYQLADEKLDGLSVKLQISLHNPEDMERDKLMPSRAKLNVKELLEAGKYFSEKRKRKVRLNYLLLKGINDDEETVSKTISIIRPYSKFFYMKLSRMNEIDNTPQYSSPGKEVFERIRDKISSAGIECDIFFGEGNDVAGNCGQLFV